MLACMLPKSLDSYFHSHWFSVWWRISFWAGLLFINDRVKMIFLLSSLYTSWLRVRYRVTSWRKGPASLCSPENSLGRLILISLGFGTFWFWFCLATAAAILSSWYLLFRVCRDSTELSVSSVWYSSSSVSLSGVGGLNLSLDVILSCSCLKVLGLGFWSCYFVLQCYSVCWRLVTRVLRIFHLLAWFCSVLGSGQQVLGLRGASVPWEVDSLMSLTFC